MNREEYHIGVLGLGYVGLPLSIEFAKLYKVTGFDINSNRIHMLARGLDHTLEVNEAELRQVLTTGASAGLTLTMDAAELASCNIFIVTVPTPVDEHNKPDLSPLIGATETVAAVLKKGDIVVYESTVYPGCTEEDCVPILEEISGLVFNVDFFCGYSPERINPGDKERTLTRIKKVTSGSTPQAAETIDRLYASVITAGTYKVSCIKVAESAKVIENAQRDINIAFVNELSKIFNLLDIDTNEVLDAAGTKWNFLPFRPGLVGGHCIGVDPYYLAQKSIAAGYYPEIILSGRRINDSMGAYVADAVIKLMLRKGMQVLNAEVLVMGITFKENCPDIRNTKVVDIVKVFHECHVKVTIFDPWANEKDVEHEYGLTSVKQLEPGKKYAAVVLAVAHSGFREMELRSLLQEPGVLYDVKGLLDPVLVDGRL